MTETQLVENSVVRNTERENQRIVEKMERDFGKRGDEPEEAEAPAASSGGGQEEKMQEEETTVMKTKRPIEDEEAEAKRPRVEAEPKNTINSDIDMDDELNKLKMQNWNFMSMVKGYDFRREKDRQRFMRELEERQPDAVFGGANRSTPNVVMKFMTKVYKKQAEKERFFVHVQDRIGVNGVVRMIQHVRELGSAITRHRRQLRLITNSMEIGRCIDKEKYDGRALSMCAIIEEGMKEEKMLKTRGLKRLMTVDSNMKVEEVHKDGDHEDMDAKLQEAWDDVSGAALDPKEIRRARLKEIRYIRDKKVWRRIPRQEALRRGYKRWIDVNKGDSTNW